MAGDPAQVAVICRIFHEFVELDYSEHRIAERLNADGIPSPAGRRWGASGVPARLRNETYQGTMVYNRTSQKLKTPRHDNPDEEWVRTPEAFEGIVSQEQFVQAQAILDERRRKYQLERLLEQLACLYKQHGLVHSSLLRLDEDLPGPGALPLGLLMRQRLLPLTVHAKSLTREQVLKAIQGRHRLAAAGMFRNPRRIWTKELLLDAIRYYRHLGLPIQALRHQDSRLLNSAISYFGNCRTALAAAGLDVPEWRWTKPRVLRELRQCYRQGPVSIFKVNRHLWLHAVRLFGTLDAALEEAGLPPPLNRWTKRRILATIQDEYVQWRAGKRQPFGNRRLKSAAQRLFGSWPAALAAAGVDAQQVDIQPRRRWSPARILAQLQERAKAGLRLCSVSGQDYGLYHRAIHHFGSWNNALMAAGLPFRVRRRWSQPAVAAALRQPLAAGQSLSASVVYQEDCGLVAAAAKYFGSWRRALEAIGVRRSRPWSRRRVAAALRRRLRQGRSLSSKCIAQQEGSSLVFAASKFFGSWRGALTAIGAEPRYRRWSSAMVVAEIRARQEQGLDCHRLVVHREDRRLLTAAERYFGNWPAALAAAGVELPAALYSRQFLTAEIQRRHRAGLSLAGAAVERESPELVRAARRIFGNWGNALAAAGVSYRPRRHWSPQLVVAELQRRQAQGLSLSLVKAYREDSGLIAAASRYFGSWNHAKQAAGIPLTRIVRRRRPRTGGGTA